MAKNSTESKKQLTNFFTSIKQNMTSMVQDQEEFEKMYSQLDTDFSNILSTIFSDGRKPKGPKDKNAPKRGRTSYIIFCTEKRPAVQAQFPELKNKEIVRKIGALWKTLTPDEQEPYRVKEKEDKVRFTEEMKKYVPPKIVKSKKEKKSEDEKEPPKIVKEKSKKEKKSEDEKELSKKEKKSKN